MSAFHETVKNILADVDRFLNTTLKEESLSKAAQKEKTKILNSLQKLYEEYEVLNPNLEDGSSNSSKGLADESRLTSTSTHSHGSHGSEEDSYTDNIPFTTVKALTDPLKTGYLVKKPTDFLEKFAKQKKKYCVVHKNILYWYKKYSDKNQQAAIFLLGYEFKDLTQNDREFIFELVSEKKKSILFQADNREDLEDWRKAIEASISSAKQIQLETQAKTGESSMIEEQYEDISRRIQRSDHALSRHEELLSMQDGMPSVRQYIARTGATYIEIDGYSFRKDRENSLHIIWRCLKRDCKARCKTSADFKKLLSQLGQHFHDPPANKDQYAKTQPEISRPMSTIGAPSQQPPASTEAPHGTFHQSTLTNPSHDPFQQSTSIDNSHGFFQPSTSIDASHGFYQQSASTDASHGYFQSTSTDASHDPFQQSALGDAFQNPLSSFSIHETSHGQLKLQIGGYFYWKQRSNNDNLVWMCQTKGCSVMCITDLSFSLISPPACEHNHERPNIVNDNEMKIDLGRNLKRKTVSDPNERPMKITCQEIEEVEDMIDHEDFQKIGYRTEASMRPNLQKNIY